MPRQSNGSYIAPANTAAVTLTSISSVAFNTLETDIGTEITNSVDRLGRSAMQAALPMGNNKITGLATPTIATDGATKAYADALGPAAFVVTGTGSADVITGVFTPTITALTNGLTVEVRATAANATTTPTFQADATAAKTLVKGAGAALVAGDIAGAGFWMSLTYDSVLDKWVLNNPSITLVTQAPPIPGSFKNLSIKVVGNTQVNAIADFIVTTDGVRFQTTLISVTINMATTGINALDTGSIAVATWYAIHGVVKPDGTTGAVASLSATSPTMPSGYTYKARLGWVRTATGVAQLLGTWQLGRRAQYIVGLAQSTDLPLVASGNNTAAWIAASVSNFVPTTASLISLTMFGQTNGGGAGQYTKVAPSNSYSLTTASPQPTLSIAGNYNLVVFPTVSADILLESTNVYMAQTNMTSGLLSCRGWEDNI